MVQGYILIGGLTMRKIKVKLTMLDTWHYVEDTLEVAEEEVQDYEIKELITEWAADQIAVTHEGV